MDFDLAEEQRILQRSARDFLGRKLSKDSVQQWEKSQEGYSPALWREMADLGWMGLVFPEEYGGSGGSFLDLVILLEEIGYHVLPGPFFSTVVLGGLSILAARSSRQREEYLPKMARGELVATLALTEEGGGYEPSSIRARGVLKDDACVLGGTKLFVPFAHVANLILWVGRTQETGRPDQGITLCLVPGDSPGVSTVILKTLSREKLCEVRFDAVRVPASHVLGEPGKGWLVVRDLLEKAALARAAEMVGGAQAVMDLALAYARERVQFGRPIGSFQVVQHAFANMWIDINGSRNLLYKAAWMISRGIPAAKEAAMAKARAGEAYRRVTSVGHQIFGGIGFTMEHPMHLYHRRSMSWDLQFGDAVFQRGIIARALGLTEEAVGDQEAPDATVP